MLLIVRRFLLLLLLPALLPALARAQGAAEATIWSCRDKDGRTHVTNLREVPRRVAPGQRCHDRRREERHRGLRPDVHAAHAAEQEVPDRRPHRCVQADDGVHLERAGGDIIASQVVRELRRVYDLWSWRSQ